MKKILIFSMLFLSLNSYAQNLQQATTNGNTTSNVIRFTGGGLLPPTGASELILGCFPSGVISNDGRVFIGRKGDAASNPTTNGPAGTILLQGRSDIADVPIDFVTGQGTSLLRMRIAGNGNISIGDNGASPSLQPAARLLIKGSGTTNASSGLLIQNSAGTEAFRVLDNGNVGINTATPNNKLEINSGASGTSGLRFTQLTSASAPATANNRALSVDASGNVILVPSGSNSFWDPSPLGTGNIRNNNTGAVIVGTVNTLPAGFKLYVSNGILTERVKVSLIGSTFWPDYVFDKNYKLKSLVEVESYITKNKHLPGVASAQELVDNGGIDVNEMFAKQMEKIEELTLYLIEQDKKIKCLEEKLKGVAKQ